MRFDLGHGLDLKFSRSNMKFAIRQPNMVQLPWNEKQTFRLNSKQQMQSSGLTSAIWPWPWIFKVKFWNSPISWIGGPIDNGYDHDRDLFVTKMRCKELRDSDQGDYRCWRAVDSSCWFPWLEDLFAFGLPYQINSQLLVIWLLLSTKLCFHFTVWVARNRPHLNVFNYFFYYTRQHM